MNQPDVCKTCGGPLSAPGGLSGRCSRCLLELGLQEESTVLTPESHLGKYQIQRLLGRGGMGEVHLAWDTELERPVALKLLPEEFASSPERLRRFQREARAAAGLNHPNICVIYEVGESDGHYFIAMEYVEGPTLRQYMDGKALPVAEAVEIALQIADGLEAARAKNIVHRDIKSANILLDQRRQVKITDFGLAKHAITRESGPEKVSVNDATTPGMVIGTAAYMSPEQAMGREVDHRGDIFSFGVVFYEMLSGRLPFQGQTTQELLVAIATETPRLNEIPQAARRVLEKMLAKTAGERYQTAGEIHKELLQVRKQLHQRNPLVRRLLVAASTLAIAAAVLAFVYLRQPYNPLEGAPPWTQITNYPGDELDGVISPDGKYIVFVSDRNGAFDIMMDEVAIGKPYPWSRGGYQEGSRNQILNMGFTPKGWVWNRPYVAGSDDTRSARPQITPLAPFDPKPFLEEAASLAAWSPDGKRLVYINNGGGDSMFVTDGEGSGKPRKIFGDGNKGMHNHSMVWSRDGEWIYFTRGQLGTPNKFEIWRIRPTGDNAEQLTHLNSDVAYLCIIDDGTILYLARDEKGFGPWLWALDVKTRTPIRVPPGKDGFFALTASADARRLVATLGRDTASLWTVPILENRVAARSDLKPLDVGQARGLTPRFAHEQNGGSSFFFLSSDGGWDGLWRYRDGKSTEVWSGRTNPLLDPPVVSPDGKQIAVLLLKNGRKVWHIASAEGSGIESIGKGLDIDGSATWNPEGTALLTGGQDKAGNKGLFLIPVDNEAPRLFLPGDDLRNPVWSAKADLIVYTGPAVKGRAPLLAVRSNGDNFKLPDDQEVRVNGTTLQSGAFLPDGKSFIYKLNQDFFQLDLATKKAHRLTQIELPVTVESFDTDGKQIYFDQFKRNSDIWMIDVPEKPWYLKIF